MKNHLLNFIFIWKGVGLYARNVLPRAHSTPIFCSLFPSSPPYSVSVILVQRRTQSDEAYLYSVSRMLTRGIFVQQWRSVAGGGRQGGWWLGSNIPAASFGAATIIHALFRRRETRREKSGRWNGFHEIKNRDQRERWKIDRIPLKKKRQSISLLFRIAL